MTDANVIEMVIFEANEGVTDDEMVAKASACSPVLSEMDGFVSRQFAKTDDGKWVDVVYWRDLAAARAAAESVLEIPVCQEFFGLIDKSGMQFRHLEIASRAP